jgi:serine/threonine-protein kinase
VISSTPAYGVKAPYGSAVQLTVGSGMVAVPNIVGKQIDEATQILVRAGLGAPVRTYRTGPQPVNDVRYQSPDKGKVPLGYQLQVTISLGRPVVLTTPPTTTPPPATGAPPTTTTTPPPGTTTTTPPVAPTTTAPVAPIAPTTSAAAAPPAKP